MYFPNILYLSFDFNRHIETERSGEINMFRFKNSAAARPEDLIP